MRRRRKTTKKKTEAKKTRMKTTKTKTKKMTRKKTTIKQRLPLLHLARLLPVQVLQSRAQHPNPRSSKMMTMMITREALTIPTTTVMPLSLQSPNLPVNVIRKGFYSKSSN